MKVLLVFSEDGIKKEFVDGIGADDSIETIIIETGTLALDFLSNNKFDLMIAADRLPDMTGVEFIEKLVMVNPMINTAVVSDLPKKEFHEATEGLGVLMSIPSTAGTKEAEDLLAYLYKINMMMSV